MNYDSSSSIRNDIIKCYGLVKIIFSNVLPEILNKVLLYCVKNFMHLHSLISVLRMRPTE